MLSRRCRSLLLVFGAIQQIADPQNIEVSRWRDAVKQILASDRRGNLPAAAKLAERLVGDLTRYEPSGTLLPEVLDRLADLQQRQGKYDEAERLYQTAVQLWEKRPDSPGRELATELNNLATFYSEMGQSGKAEIARRHSLTLRLRLLGPEHPEVALSYANLASDMFRQGKYLEAETLAHEAIEVWRHGPLDARQEDLAYNTLAMTELHTGHYQSALQFIRLALQTYSEHGISDDVRLACYQHALALIQEANGDSQQAAHFFQISLATLRRANTADPMQRIGILMDYAALLRKIGRSRDAHKMELEAAKNAKQVMKNNAFKDSVDVSELLHERR